MPSSRAPSAAARAGDAALNWSIRWKNSWRRVRVLRGGLSGRVCGIQEEAGGDARFGGAVGIGTGDAGFSSLRLVVVEAAGPGRAGMILGLGAGGGGWGRRAEGGMGTAVLECPSRRLHAN